MDKLSYFFQQLEELCQEIYQNSNSENYYQSEWNIKIPAQNFRKRNKQHKKCKKKQMDKLEEDWNGLQLRFLKTFKPNSF